jgi:hypothetical protein
MSTLRGRLLGLFFIALAVVCGILKSLSFDPAYKFRESPMERLFAALGVCCLALAAWFFFWTRARK